MRLVKVNEEKRGNLADGGYPPAGEAGLIADSKARRRAFLLG